MPTFHTVDLDWTGRPRSLAALLVESAGRCAVIDPGPESTLEALRRGLAARGRDVQSLDSLLLTHIHLDHAGATGALVRENPGLRVYVQEFGAVHMIDPSRLLSSAGRLYGDHLKLLYGGCRPVPEANLRPLEGGETIRVGELDLQVFYTPGHASHHVTFWDRASRTAFVGDTAGLRVEGHSFLLPATPPPDIDLEQWKGSLEIIASWSPERLFLTHFGYVEDPAEHIRLYRERLEEWGRLARELLSAGHEEGVAERKFVESVSAEVRSALDPASAEHYIFNGALGLSWQGLARYAKKKAAGAEG
jgi:glyoxylase-like metal-dependent hydrolase (beta-lactamase superfamily II)